uniref:Uncharacterized protein n=1 Tax=Aegilops tauschii subsp. strangulata TaxID=200361 RepID=A0A453GIF3_AEGTS
MHRVHNSTQLVFLLMHKWQKQLIRVYPNLAYQGPVESSAEASIQSIPRKFSLSRILILHHFSMCDTENKRSTCLES